MRFSDSMSCSSDITFEAGTRVAGYQIECELGRGAMAVVYKAIQLNLDRPVALKILSKELAASEEFVVRFFNEARAAAALSHVHIIQAYDAGVTEEKVHYFAMEYVEGETLLQRIQRQGYMRPGPGIQLAVDIADALNYGWERQQLTHGDIKPENIMINMASQSKLADFGLAKVAEHAFDGSDIMLTPLYAAPEMIRGEHTKGDCRADIYSFGATLYHTFGGTPPYPGDKAQEVMQRQLTEPLEPLRDRNPAVPGMISDFVGSLLKKDQTQRPATWAAVLNGLRDIQKGLSRPGTITKPAIQAVPIRHVRKARRASDPKSKKLMSWLAAFSLIVVGGLIALRDEQRNVATDPVPAKPGVPSTPGTATKPGPAPAQTDTTAEDDWDQVRAKVEKQGNPEKGLALLEDYAARRPNHLPYDFAALLAEYREAVSWRRATQSSAQKPGREWVFKGGDNTGLGDAPPGTDAGVPGTGSGTGNGGDVDPKQATQDPDGGGTSGRDPSGGVAPVRRIVVPLAGHEDERADAFVAYMAQLSHLTYRVPLKVDPLVQAGNQWLLEYPEDSSDRATVTFVVRTVLPALDEALPKLAANSDRLLGARLPGRSYARCTLREVTLSRLVLQEQTQYGMVLRNIEWRRHSDPVPIIVYLSQLAFAASGSLETRRPYLALLLFTKYGEKHWAESLSGLADSPEKRSWEAARKVLSEAVNEGSALRLWERAVKACREGETILAYRSLRELQSTRSAVLGRHQGTVTALLEKVSGTVPEIAGGKLVRDAVAEREKPEEALRKLNLATARYGDADFPEKQRLREIRQRVLAALPLPDWLERSARRHPLTTIVAFGDSSSEYVPAYLTMRMYVEAATRAEEVPPRVSRGIPLLQGPALLQMGDWAEALSELSPVRNLLLEELPVASRASLIFSQGVVWARFGGGDTADVVKGLDACLATAATRQQRYASLVRVFMAEYGLVLRDPNADLGLFLRLDEPSAQDAPKARRRLALDAAALCLEAGKTSRAVAILQQPLSSQQQRDEWGLSDGDAVFLQQVALLAGGKATPRVADALALGDMTEWHLRLLVAAALASGPLPEEVWLHASEFIAVKGGALGPIGGGGAYCAAISHIGRRLSAGDLAGSVTTADWALEQPYACLFPFYARLVFVRTGITQLAEGMAGATDLSETVGAAQCATPTEKAIAGMLLGDSQNSKARDAARDTAEGRFWYDWLAITAGALGKDDAERLEYSRRLASMEMPHAERRLAEGLTAWIQRRGAASTPRN